MGQAGIPLFYLQGMGGGAVLKFRDLFNDNSLFWGWRLFKGQVSETGKSGVEANGRYTLLVGSGYNGRWNSSYSEAPRIFIGVLTYPVEIITKLETFSNIEDSQTGLFVTKYPVGFGSNLYFAIVQRRKVGVNNVCVIQDGDTVLATGIASVLPMWFRIRLGCGGYNSLNAYFDYSLDGLNWTNLYTQNTGWGVFSISGISTGICTQNFSTLTISEASYDFFEMKPGKIN